MGADDLPSDEDLMRATPNDPESFGMLYRRHERAVGAYFMRRTGDAELAADLTAETFAAALIAAPRYQPTGAVGAWLFGIARNLLLRSVERSRVEGRARRRLGLRIELTDDVREHFERLAGDQTAELILLELAPEQADAVRSRVLEDASYAAVLGSSSGKPREVPAKLPSADSALAVGSQAPVNVLRPVFGGQPSVSARLRQITLVTFGASWCAPWVDDLPEIAAAQRQLEDAGGSLLYVATREPPRSFRALDVPPALRPRVFSDRTGKYAKAWGVTGFPWSALVARDGRIAATSADDRHALPGPRRRRRCRDTSRLRGWSLPGVRARRDP